MTPVPTPPILLQEPRRDVQATALAVSTAIAIYTPNSRDRVVIESVNAAHKTGATFTFTLALVSGGVEYILVYQASVAANTPYRTPTGFNLPLASTDFLRAYGAANVDVVVVAKSTGGNLG